MKKCSKCGQIKPATIEFFPKCSKNKDGLSGNCKECRYEQNKIIRTNKKLGIHEPRKLLTEEERREYRRQYDKTHPRPKKMTQETRNELLKYRTKEYINRKCKEYYHRHKEQSAERIKKWRQNNPDKMAAHAHKHRARKRSLPHTLTHEQWKEILKHFDNSCAYCGSTKKLTQEHFIPVSKGGHYTKNNIIPACNSCNSSKCATDFDDWYPRQTFYSEERARKIMEYLDENI